MIRRNAELPGHKKMDINSRERGIGAKFSQTALSQAESMQTRGGVRILAPMGMGRRLHGQKGGLSWQTCILNTNLLRRMLHIQKHLSLENLVNPNITYFI